MVRGRYREQSPYRRNRDLERARQHIEEAKELSRELGGTDKDVKEYFFSLSAPELQPILDEYEKLHGVEAREYAAKTLPRWRSGRTKMSGLVAGRLFALLPSRMPLHKKYALVKTLWKSKCPSSDAEFYVGPDAEIHEVCAAVRGRLNEVVAAYRIPDVIVSQFRWLAQNDVDLQEQLHNYFFRQA